MNKYQVTLTKKYTIDAENEAAARLRTKELFGADMSKDITNIHYSCLDIRPPKPRYLICDKCLRNLTACSGCDKPFVNAKGVICFTRRDSYGETEAEHYCSPVCLAQSEAELGKVVMR